MNMPQAWIKIVPCIPCRIWGMRGWIPTYFTQVIEFNSDTRLEGEGEGEGQIMIFTGSRFSTMRFQSQKHQP